MNLYNFHKSPEQLKGHDEQDILISDYIWIRATSGKKLAPNEERIISRNAYKSMYYAKNIIRKHFLQAEDTIAKSKFKERYEKEFGIKL